MPLFVWRLGDACLVGQPNEAYSQFQIELRRAFPDRAIAVMNLVNGSAGYLPPSEMYDRDCYQVTQSPFSRGSLENLIQAATRIVAEMNDDPSPSPLYSGERAGERGENPSAEISRYFRSNASDPSPQPSPRSTEEREQ
jgi:hypothetical protein